MNKSIIRSICTLSVLQVIVYLFGFVNWAAKASHWNAMLDIYASGFGTIMFWSLLSCLSVVITVLSFYALTTGNSKTNNRLGVILAIIGALLPLILMFFLVIPATVLILAVFFMNFLNLKNTK